MPILQTYNFIRLWHEFMITIALMNLRAILQGACHVAAGLSAVFYDDAGI